MSQAIIDNIKFINIPNKRAGVKIGNKLTQTNIGISQTVADYINSNNFYKLVNAVDIDWNGIEIDENTYINTTTDLIKWIASKSNSEAIVPHIGENGNWFIGDIDTNVYASGTQGTRGMIGLQGTMGVQGPTGMQGTRGMIGLQGTMGVQGPTGMQGTRGITGLQGTIGVQGAIGMQGTRGMTGLQGTIGVQGTRGMTGLQGTIGVQGAIGMTGLQGTMGVQGLKGDAGTFDSSELKNYINKSKFDVLLDVLNDINSFYISSKFVWKQKPTNSLIELFIEDVEKPVNPQRLNMMSLTGPTNIYIIYPLSWEIVENDNIIKPIITDVNNLQMGVWYDNPATIQVNNIVYRILCTELGQGIYTLQF